MSSNQKKAGLLNKKKKGYSQIEEEWIQLEDMRGVKEQAPYSKFDEKQIKVQVEPKTNENKSKINDNSKITPSQSMVDKPNTIKMNGTTFQKVGTSTENSTIKRSKIPLMEVACEYCTMLQKVPGNTQVYICGSCQNMNQCYPLYGIFICGCCQCQVCYGFGTSQYIRCTRCGTINKVPFQPQKNYKSSEQKSKKVEKKEVKREVEVEKRQIIPQQLLLSDIEQKPELKSELNEKDLEYDDIL